MRTGACAVQQALTSEAASVLKHALGLARRRGHAQVTPLHVAATLLSSARDAGSLFRRACLRSHPRHRSSHPLQCRALELCFNVALNRLPTVPPPSSGPLFPPNPAFSNALVAALKRAQAHQRRGCIEQQQQQQMPPPAAQPEPPPLLAVKVELEQLIISILDDPSVSRVMREAGFSSTSVKNSLEEDASSAPSSPVSLDRHRDVVTFASAFCPPPPPVEPAPLLPSASQEEDLRLLLDVLLGKKNQRRRSNAVVVADSVSYGELLVAELMSKVERGEVPEELRSAQWVRLQLSCGSTLASRAEVEMKVSQLRKKVSSLVPWGGGGGAGVILYAGDLRWAIDEDPAVSHLVAEVGRLLSELRAAGGSKVWLVAVADLQTYMNWKKRQPSLELQWGLQPVSVPSGGLALSLHIPSSGRDLQSCSPLKPLELKKQPPPREDDGHEKLACCAECTSSLEREAFAATSPVFLRSGGAIDGSPLWTRPNRSEKGGEDVLLELRRKWNWVCRSLRHESWSSQVQQSFDSFLDRRAALPRGPNCGGGFFPDLTPKAAGGSGSLLERDSATTWLSEARTGLALGGGVSLFSDSATSAADLKKGVTSGHRRELWRRLNENVPWQSEILGSIAEALSERGSDGKHNKGIWLLLRGSDGIGKRRLSLAISEFFCASADKLVVRVNARKAEPHADLVVEALRRDPNSVFLIEEVDWAEADFLRVLSQLHANGGGGFRDLAGSAVSSDEAVFILCASSGHGKTTGLGEEDGGVIAMKLHVEDSPSPSPSPPANLKRKILSDETTSHRAKNPRTGEGLLDLNVSPGDSENEGATAGGEGEEEEEVQEEGVPSDLTHEMGSDDLLGSIGHRFAVDMCPERRRRMAEHFLWKLRRSFDEARAEGGGHLGISSLSVDGAAVEQLAAASGSFLDSLFDEWLRQVFQPSLRTPTKTGPRLRLLVEEGRPRSPAESGGFHGSALPTRIPRE